MLGIHAKRGIESTLERVFQSTGNKFDSLEFRWGGSTAGVAFKRHKSYVDATIIMPNFDETQDISRDVYNQHIGFCLHELGHVWFTDNEPWDNESEKRGDFFHALVNGLEDPRIEQKVIDSGYAANSFILFERLLNAMIEKSGFPEVDDFDNLPFMLAVEGRRLNGYKVNVPCIFPESPWSDILQTALHEAKVASNTQEVVDAAIKLFDALHQSQEQQQQQPQQQPQQSKQTDQDTDQGDDQNSNQDTPSDASESPTSDDQGAGKVQTRGNGKKRLEVEPSALFKAPYVDVWAERPAVRINKIVKFKEQ